MSSLPDTAAENSLQIFIRRQKLDPVETMNRLMNEGLVSDNAVLPSDVAGADCFKACLFLQKNQK